MKAFIFFIFLVAITQAHAQTQKAPLNVIVMNKAGKAIANDKITFIGQKSGIEIVGITNVKGQFLVHLPAGDAYAIKVDVIGEELDYNTFEVPTPPQGAVFNTRTLEIVYDLPTAVVLKDLHFASGKHTIQASSYAVLDQLAEYLIRKKTLKIRVEGHTDSDGSEASNLTLSQNRAIAVKAYLEKKGVPATLIVTSGFGEEKPIADNATADGKAQNRRTEIHVVE